MSRRQQPVAVEQYVIPPDGGLITRFPSNQTWRKNYSGLSVASNVRAASGRLYNAPGYEDAPFYPAIVAPPLLITDVELVQGAYHVLGDASNLYAVTEDLVPSIYPGAGGVVAGLSFTFADATATGYLGAALGVTWSQVSGPGTSTFSDPGAINATVTVTLPGLYTFQLSGSDGITTVTASVSVRFITCTASPNYTFPSYLGGTLALTGVILGVTNPSDPRSDSSSYEWVQVSGPASVVFNNTGILDPVVMVPGTSGVYVLGLRVSVGTTSYTAQITVNVPAVPPTVVTFTDNTNASGFFAGTNFLFQVSIDGGAYFTPAPASSYPVAATIFARISMSMNMPNFPGGTYFFNKIINLTRTGGGGSIKVVAGSTYGIAAFGTFIPGIGSATTTSDLLTTPPNKARATIINGDAPVVINDAVAATTPMTEFLLGFLLSGSDGSDTFDFNLSAYADLTIQDTP